MDLYDHKACNASLFLGDTKSCVAKRLCFVLIKLSKGGRPKPRSMGTACRHTIERPCMIKTIQNRRLIYMYRD